MPSAPKFRRFAIVALLIPLSLLVVPGQATTATAAASSPTLKPLLTGLLDRTGPPSAEFENVIRSYVVNVNWSSLQPKRRGALRTSGLDRQLAEARSNGARVKLRILAGIHSPRWTKKGGIKLRDPQGGRGKAPLFWTKSFGRAYNDLQRKMAARYDANQTVAEVVISRCTTFYAEPFVRQTAIKKNRTAMLRAGYTAKRDKKCHKSQIKAHRVWQRTRAGLAFNPAQFVKAHKQVVSDRFTVSMMRYCRSRLGSRCVLENNSIRSPIHSLDKGTKPHYQRMYANMVRHSPSRAFQTATAARMGSCAATLDWAADRGAAYVELPWNPDDAGCSMSVLREAADRLG